MEVINVLYDKGIDRIKDKIATSSITKAPITDNCSIKDRKVWVLIG
jgi:hypothetical protein